jgi:succinate dehydrogenase/fumarate reductase cytochrome b subunit
MTTLGEQRSLADLVGGLSRDISMLFRKEVELAKAEAQESVGKAIHSVVALLIGAVLALGALGVLLSAAVSGLAILFVNWGLSAEAATALSAVIIGVIVAIIAWVFVNRGINGLKAENLWLDRTTHAVQRDAHVLKEKVNG